MPRKAKDTNNTDAYGRNYVVSKYRRQRTLISKMLELSAQCQLKINLFIYDPKFHRMDEIWSHDDFKFDNVNNLLNERNDGRVINR